MLACPFYSGRVGFTVDSLLSHTPDNPFWKHGKQQMSINDIDDD